MGSASSKKDSTRSPKKEPSSFSDLKTLSLILLMSTIGFLLTGVITWLIGFFSQFFGYIFSFDLILILFSILSLIAYLVIPGFFGGNESSSGALRLVLTLLIINGLYFGNLYLGYMFPPTGFAILSIIIILLVPILLMIKSNYLEK